MTVYVVSIEPEWSDKERFVAQVFRTFEAAVGWALRYIDRTPVERFYCKPTNWKLHRWVKCSVVHGGAQWSSARNGSVDIEPFEVRP